jgi:hypothetical protein
VCERGELGRELHCWLGVELVGALAAGRAATELRRPFLSLCYNHTCGSSSSEQYTGRGRTGTDSDWRHTQGSLAARHGLLPRCRARGQPRAGATLGLGLGSGGATTQWGWAGLSLARLRRQQGEWQGRRSGGGIASRATQCKCPRRPWLSSPTTEKRRMGHGRADHDRGCGCSAETRARGSSGRKWRNGAHLGRRRRR